MHVLGFVYLASERSTITVCHLSHNIPWVITRTEGPPFANSLVVLTSIPAHRNRVSCRHPASHTPFGTPSGSISTMQVIGFRRPQSH